MTVPHARRALAIALAGAAFAAANTAHASHAWSSYHWARTTAQFTLQLGNNLTTADWRMHLMNASSDWNSPQLFGASFTPVLTAVVAGRSSTCGMTPGTTQVCNGHYGRNGWLGLASINISGSHITQGTAKMNDSYFTLSTYNNPNEKRHVMCQEIAHTFGLTHQSTNGTSQNTCMDYFANTGIYATSTRSTRPNKHDFDQLALIYANLDSTTTVATTTTTASRGVDVSHDPKTWGRLVRQSANGRASFYERDNDDGSVTVTHVYWTQEAAERCPACDHRDEEHE